MRHTLFPAAFALLICCAWWPVPTRAQAFVHPGIDQRPADLAYMKQVVREGREPWKSAYERLLAATDTGFVAHPFAHVLRGPYGRPNVGGKELASSASMAYNCALLWYITGDHAYAATAIRILNAWSPVLQDFDYNDAKLLAAWTGHDWCNAAEILLHTQAGWAPADVARFKGMLLDVYYPLLRFYYPTANGNWDGAIIHSLMAIAIFTDNRPLFNDAVDHFLHGPMNGSLFKYIYPTGQCQESQRDQGHVQLGLGEFAGAAQVAYSQGVDLYSLGNNRLALGYAYTARFLLGDRPFCYGTLSERAMSLRDDYESVYRHYEAQGLSIPYIRRAADSVRPGASRSVLTALRRPQAPAGEARPLVPDTTAYRAGATVANTPPAGAMAVSAGASIQEALDSAAGTGRWVWLRQGLHTLKAPLRIPSGVTLAGEGPSTILFLDPASGERDAIVCGPEGVHDVTFRDFVLEGGISVELPSDPNSVRSFRNKGNRGGILLRSEAPGNIHDLRFIRLTVRNCTSNGISVSGGKDLVFERCNLEENGSSVVPGPRLQHNLLLTDCEQVQISRSRLDGSPFGSGLALIRCRQVRILGNEVARNAWHGILIRACRSLRIDSNTVEGNDGSGICAERFQERSAELTLQDNLVWYNAGYGIAMDGVGSLQAGPNRLLGNGPYGSNPPPSQSRISDQATGP